MRLRRSITWFLIPGVGLVAIVAAVLWINTHANVAYPLSVWRMDLDDAAVGFGTILAGIAAIWTVKLKADSADAKADTLAYQLNGGLAELAREHLQDNEVIAGLLHRMDRFEAERDDCIEERKELQQWVIGRLDASGHGRDQTRE